MSISSDQKFVEIISSSDEADDEVIFVPYTKPPPPVVDLILDSDEGGGGGDGEGGGVEEDKGKSSPDKKKRKKRKKTLSQHSSSSTPSCDQNAAQSSSSSALNNDIIVDPTPSQPSSSSSASGNVISNPTGTGSGDNTPDNESGNNNSHQNETVGVGVQGNMDTVANNHNDADSSLTQGVVSNDSAGIGGVQGAEEEANLPTIRIASSIFDFTDDDALDKNPNPPGGGGGGGNDGSARGGSNDKSNESVVQDLTGGKNNKRKTYTRKKRDTSSCVSAESGGTPTAPPSAPPKRKRQTARQRTNEEINNFLTTLGIYVPPESLPPSEGLETGTEGDGQQKKKRRRRNNNVNVVLPPNAEELCLIPPPPGSDDGILMNNSYVPIPKTSTTTTIPTFPTPGNMAPPSSTSTPTVVVDSGPPRKKSRTNRKKSESENREKVTTPQGTSEPVPGIVGPSVVAETNVISVPNLPEPAETSNSVILPSTSAAPSPVPVPPTFTSMPRSETVAVSNMQMPQVQFEPIPPTSSQSHSSSPSKGRKDVETPKSGSSKKQSSYRPITPPPIFGSDDDEDDQDIPEDIREQRRREREEIDENWRSYLPSRWTPEMVQFYNCNDPERERMSLNRTLFSMSDDPSLWRCRKSESQRKRFTHRGARCINCLQYGHVKKQCPEKPKGRVCHLCGRQGHGMTSYSRAQDPSQRVRCSRAVCLNCGRRQDCIRNGCERCLFRRPVLRCSVCDVEGHDRVRCPDLWRKFFGTTSGVPSRDGSTMYYYGEKPQYRLHRDAYCSICAEKGHSFFHCRSSHANRAKYPRQNPRVLGELPSPPPPRRERIETVTSATATATSSSPPGSERISDPSCTTTNSTEFENADASISSEFNSNQGGVTTVRPPSTVQEIQVAAGSVVNEQEADKSVGSALHNEEIQESETTLSEMEQGREDSNEGHGNNEHPQSPSVIMCKDNPDCQNVFKDDNGPRCHEVALTTSDHNLLLKAQSELIIEAILGKDEGEQVCILKERPLAHIFSPTNIAVLQMNLYNIITEMNDGVELQYIKRANPPQSSPEIIILDDDDDEEDNRTRRTEPLTVGLLPSEWELLDVEHKRGKDGVISLITERYGVTILISKDPHTAIIEGGRNELNRTIAKRNLVRFLEMQAANPNSDVKFELRDNLYDDPLPISPIKPFGGSGKKNKKNKGVKRPHPRSFPRDNSNKRQRSERHSPNRNQGNNNDLQNDQAQTNQRQRVSPKKKKKNKGRSAKDRGFNTRWGPPPPPHVNNSHMFYQNQQIPPPTNNSFFNGLSFDGPPPNNVPNPFNNFYPPHPPPPNQNNNPGPPPSLFSFNFAIDNTPDFNNFSNPNNNHYYHRERGGGRGRGHNNRFRGGRGSHPQAQRNFAPPSGPAGSGRGRGNLLRYYNLDGDGPSSSSGGPPPS